MLINPLKAIAHQLVVDLHENKTTQFRSFLLACHFVGLFIIFVIVRRRYFPTVCPPEPEDVECSQCETAVLAQKIIVGNAKASPCLCLLHVCE